MGYGDITSASDLERCFSIVGMIIGATVFGYIIGNVAAIMENFNVTDAIENDKMNQIKEWLYDRKVIDTFLIIFGSTRALARFKVLSFTNVHAQHGELGSNLARCCKKAPPRVIGSSLNSPAAHNVPTHLSLAAA